MPVCVHMHVHECVHVCFCVCVRERERERERERDVCVCACVCVVMVIIPHAVLCRLNWLGALFVLWKALTSEQIVSSNHRNGCAMAQT